MRRFHFHKGSVLFFIGFIGIVGIIVFYGRAYFQKLQPKIENTSITDRSFLTDDTFITANALTKKIQQNKSTTILIDIRPNSLFESEHIPQSTSIPFEIINGLNIKDGFSFVIVTSAGNEQGLGVTAAQILHAKNNTTPLFILKGGFEGWKSTGGQIVSFGNPESVIDQSKVNYVTPEELRKRFDKRTQTYFIIDMRPKDAYDQGRVQSAVNLPLDQLEKLYEKIPVGSRIIAYGNSELEDFQAGVRLFDLGFFPTEILKGGFLAWKDKGFDTQK